LEIAIVNGNDINARSALLSASNLAGMAISSARVGLVHAMSHALGAKYGISHGIGCGLLLPHVIRWNSQILNIAERYLPIAQAAGINILDNSHEVSIKALIEKIQYLLEAIGHPTKLSHSGISNQDIKTLAIYAFSDLSILTNARTVYSIEEIEEIYNNAF
jgi:alcohol dehydrogenase